MCVKRKSTSELIISIIIPVYNTKDYLSRCIESVLNQTYQNIEIILVDDGSTDGSDQICDIYKEKDSRIIVLHKENQGNMGARKAGVEVANGEYIGFIDSDDWIEPDMYERLSFCAKQSNSDVVCSGYFVEENDSISTMNDGVQRGKYKKENNYTILIENLIYEKGSERRGISMSLCNKIIRKDIAKQVVLDVDDDIQILEDALCVYSSILRASSTYVMNECFYHYCMREGSILHSKDEEYFIKINLAYNALKQEVEKYSEYKDILIPQLGKMMVDYLAKGINYYFDFGVRVSIPYYLFPFDKIKSGTRVILYGAGRFGQTYYKQIMNSKAFIFVAWVDKNYEEFQKKGMPVESIESINVREYDCIFLGVQDEGTADSMTNSLLRLGVDPTKIIWEKPRSIFSIVS